MWLVQCWTAISLAYGHGTYVDQIIELNKSLLMIVQPGFIGKLVEVNKRLLENSPDDLRNKSQP